MATKKKPTRKRAPAARTPRPVYVSAEPWEGSWHLDKRVPVALIITMCIQIFAGVWWASRIDSEMQTVKMNIEHLRREMTSKDEKFEKIAVFGVELKSLQASTTKVEKTLELIRDRLTFEQSKDKR